MNLEIASLVPSVLLLGALLAAGARILRKRRGTARLFTLGPCSYCAHEVLCWAYGCSGVVEFISLLTVLGWTLSIGFWEEASGFYQRSGPKIRRAADYGIRLLVFWGAALLVLVPAGKLPPSTFFGSGWGWLSALVVLASAVTVGLDRAGSYFWPQGVEVTALRRFSSFCLASLLALLLSEVIWTATGCMGFNGWEVYANDGIYRGSFGKRKEFSVALVRNSRGYYDVEHEPRPTAATERILILGDSYVEAVQVPIEQRISRQLEQQVNSHFPTSLENRNTYECIAVGRSGTGAIWQQEMLESEGLDYDPSIIISEVLPANDIRDNDIALRNRARRELSFKLNHGRLYQLLKRRRLQAPGALLYRVDRLLADYRTDMFVFHEPPSDPVWQQAWARTEEAIIGMQALASRHGALFVVVIFSSPPEIEAWVDPEQANTRFAALAVQRGLSADGWDLRYPARRIEALCAAAAIPVLNLSRVFAELSPRQRNRIHMQSDGHWSPFGHRLAAEALADFLNDQLQASRPGCAS